MVYDSFFPNSFFVSELRMANKHAEEFTTAIDEVCRETRLVIRTLKNSVRFFANYCYGVMEMFVYLKELGRKIQTVT